MLLFDASPRTLFGISLQDFKVYAEIAAYALGSAFILLKLIDGQINATMEVSLELERGEMKDSPEADFLAIKLALKRADIGRLRLQDIVLELSDASDNDSPKTQIRDEAIRKELSSEARREGIAGWMYLPPKEGTQLGYFHRVGRDIPILVEVRIVTTRTGFGRWHRPQWRASAVSLPNRSGKQ